MEVDIAGMTACAPIQPNFGFGYTQILDAIAREDANFARVLASYNKYR